MFNSFAFEAIFPLNGFLTAVLSLYFISWKTITISIFDAILLLLLLLFFLTSVVQSTIYSVCRCSWAETYARQMDEKMNTKYTRELWNKYISTSHIYSHHPAVELQLTKKNKKRNKLSKKINKNEAVLSSVQFFFSLHLFIV